MSTPDLGLPQNLQGSGWGAVESLGTGKTDVLDVELDAGTFDPNDYNYPTVDRFNVKWGATLKVSDCIMGKPHQVSEAVRM